MSTMHGSLPEGTEPPPPGVGLMGFVRWMLVLCMALLAVVSVVDYARVTQAAAVSAGVQYYCPMHPSVVQDHPGECPICSMTLVRRDEKDTTTSARPETSTVPGLVSVELPADRVQRIGVRTAVARRAPLGEPVRTVGYVSVGEDRTAKIHPRFAGWIERLAVNTTGQAIRRGDVLATIYSPEVLTAQQELLNARRWARNGGDVHSLTGGLADDARHRLALLGIASDEIARIERTGAVITALPLRAPVSGVVLSKTAIQGAYVEPSMELFAIGDLSAIWVLADVYERDLPRVRAGVPAHLRLAAWPGESWLGRVDFVPPTVAPDTRTARVRIVFANTDGRLRPGSYGDVTLDVAPSDGLVIPAEAVVDTGDQQYVFLASEGGRFEPRLVRLGTRRGADVEITDGLSDGDRVVTTANFLIDSESRLRAAISGTQRTDMPAHQH